MPEAIGHVLDLLCRYIHIVCATLLVGGTLFYEMVVPAAIADLKEEQQLSVFARARWIFNSVVWTSVILMVVSGIVSSRRHWPEYARAEQPTVDATDSLPMRAVPAARRPGWWWVAHLSTGGLALLIAVSLTAGSRPPNYPVQWMRINMVILLVVIFLGSATRHMRLFAADSMMQSITSHSATNP
jgi:hypothetical protein